MIDSPGCSHWTWCLCKSCQAPRYALLGLYFWNLEVQERMRWGDFTRGQKYWRLRHRQAVGWDVADNGDAARRLEEYLWAVPEESCGGEG